MEPRESFCIIKRGNRRLALSADAVRRVLSGGVMTRIPGAPPHLVGLVEDRGAALPVVGLDGWLGQVPRAWSSGDAVVVVETDGLRFGVLADRVEGVAPLAEGPDASTDGGALTEPNLIAACRFTSRGPVVVLATAALAQAAVAAADRAFAANQPTPMGFASPAGDDRAA